MLAVQYLEDSPDLEMPAPAAARACLAAALELLPITCVILGWNVPEEVRRACADEAAQRGAQLFRWHPLLAGDAAFVPRPEWRVIGLDGQPLVGYRGLPEFTFICPNRPAARDAALAHLLQAMRLGSYQGVFLDRIRYPSPAADPARLLGCFCEDCRRTAAGEGLDLAAAQAEIRALARAPQQAAAVATTLLDPLAPAAGGPGLAALAALLDFRARSVTRLVRAAAEAIRAEGRALGLDCFSPALARMVGQDLAALDGAGDWIKVMVYGHTQGPAGLPYELLQLAGWLAHRGGLGEAAALATLSRAAHLPLPATRAALAGDGIAPQGLAGEISRARAAGVRTLLAGVELVRVPRVTRLSAAQIAADLAAIRAAGADGLALSWDLRHMPPEWLQVAALHAG